MNKILKYFAILAFVSQAILGARQADEITSLPGLDGKLPSKQYSGYLDITDKKHYHYWFVECETDPENAPVVLWLNGGPGCSSLDGLIYETGPFRLDGSTSPPTLYRFDYTWAKLANMIYLESPIGVGFTYSEDDNDYNCTDDTTSMDNLLSVQRFFELFPEYTSNPFYITGFSYGGVYVPTLAEAILSAALENTYTGAPLKGIAVGNGCTGNEIGSCAHHFLGNTFRAQYFVENTAFLSQSLKRKLSNNCNWDTPYDINFRCGEAMIEMSKQLYRINGNSIYEECNDDKKGNMIDLHYLKYAKDNLDFGEFGPTDCGINSEEASAYFNREDVIEAIHVQKPNFEWAVCATDERWSYHRTRPNLPRDTYPFLNENIRVVIYNGDWDAAIPYTDNDWWTRNMGYEVADDWHEWFYKSTGTDKEQVGGYATRYATQYNFTFITIRGGRHEVPETAPAASFEMLKRLVTDTQF